MLYSRPSGCGRSPATDATLIMEPEPRSHIPGATSFTRRNALFRLISTILSNCPSSTSRHGPCAIFVAALFTRMSMRPNWRTAESTRFRIWSILPIWQATAFTLGPISRATWSSVSCLRPQMTTFAPSRTKTSAMALPMPRLAPVTIATLSLRMLIAATLTFLGVLKPSRLLRGGVSLLPGAPLYRMPRHASRINVRHLYRQESPKMRFRGIQSASIRDEYSNGPRPHRLFPVRRHTDARARVRARHGDPAELPRGVGPRGKTRRRRGGAAQRAEVARCGCDCGSHRDRPGPLHSPDSADCGTDASPHRRGDRHLHVLRPAVLFPLPRPRNRAGRAGADYRNVRPGHQRRHRQHKGESGNPQMRHR